MYDKLAHRLVMLGNDDKQALDDDQLYLVGGNVRPYVDKLHFKIGPSLTDAPEGVTVSVFDLAHALAEFGLRLERAV